MRDNYVATQGGDISIQEYEALRAENPTPEQKNRLNEIAERALLQKMIGDAAQVKPSGALIFKPGETWLFFTIAFYHCGRITRVLGDFIELEAGSLRIEDSGAVANALKSGKFDRSEVISERVILNAQSLTSSYHWPNKLPKGQG